MDRAGCEEERAGCQEGEVVNRVDGEEVVVVEEEAGEDLVWDRLLWEAVRL